MTNDTTTNRCDELVTVIAICYNQSCFLRKSLDSIMAQTWRPGHFYIIDDCSTDNSVALINEWLEENGHPATLLVHEQNQGITKTMNHALSLCKTKYFHPWPCDDLMMPDKIESQVTYMESLEWQPGFLYGDIQWIDSEDNVLRESVITNRKKLFEDGQMPTGFVFPELIKHGCFITTASGLYVTKVLEDLGGFDEKLFAEDWDMFIRISLHSGIAFKEQVFSKYRRHEHSAEMKKGERYWRSRFMVLSKYFGISAEYDNLIWKKIGEYALGAYREGFSDAGKWVWKAFKNTRDYRLLYYYLRLKLKV
jgi:glycosyltransferase involved in cell wall biosynthesis